MSTLGWENWINFNSWKFTHFVQTVLQKMHQISRGKGVNSQNHDDNTKGPAQLPTKFIECLPKPIENSEKTSDEPSKPKVKADLNAKHDDMPGNQQASEQSSSNTHANAVEPLKGKFYSHQ